MSDQRSVLAPPEVLADLAAHHDDDLAALFDLTAWADLLARLPRVMAGV